MDTHDQRLTPGSIRAVYGEEYAGWVTDDSEWKGAQISDFLTDHLPRLGSLADVGCGNGDVVAEVQRRNPTVRVEGFEPTQLPIAMASARHPEIEFTVGFPSNNTFEMIMLIDVIEHVPDCWGLLERTSQAAPLLLAHIPLEFNVSSALRPSSLAAARENLGHIHHFSPETAEALLVDCGYEIIARRFTTATIDLPTSSTKRRLARIPRRALRTISPTTAARVLGGFEILLLARRVAAPTSSHPSAELRPDEGPL